MHTWYSGVHILDQIVFFLLLFQHMCRTPGVYCCKLYHYFVSVLQHTHAGSAGSDARDALWKLPCREAGQWWNGPCKDQPKVGCLPYCSMQWGGGWTVFACFGSCVVCAAKEIEDPGIYHNCKFKDKNRVLPSDPLWQHRECILKPSKTSSHLLLHKQNECLGM